jgi:hypothetical protein
MKNINWRKIHQIIPFIGIFIVLLIVLLTGCANKPKIVEGAEKPEIMSRREVVRGVQECEDAGMKPYVEYLTQKTDYGKVLVAVNVHCDPKRK